MLKGEPPAHFSKVLLPPSPDPISVEIKSKRASPPTRTGARLLIGREPASPVKRIPIGPFSGLPSEWLLWANNFLQIVNLLDWCCRGPLGPLGPLAQRSSNSLYLSGLTARTQFVQHDGQDDDRSLDDQLPIKGDVHQSKSIIKDGDDQSPDQRPKDSSNSADETGATQDHRRDSIQLISNAQLALSAVQTAGAHDAIEAGQKPAHSIGENQYKRYGDTGQSSCLRITTDSIDMHT